MVKGRSSRFLFVRDDFYQNPDLVRQIAQSMEYYERDDITGYMTKTVYHEHGIRQRLEKILGVRTTRWDSDPDEGNGIFYGTYSRGSHREIPGVHYDQPIE